MVWKSKIFPHQMWKTQNRIFIDSKGTEALFLTFNTLYYYY